MSLSSLFYAILSGVIPCLIWLHFWLREDAHDQPRPLIVSLFIGGMIAVLIAIIGEKWVETFDFVNLKIFFTSIFPPDWANQVFTTSNIKYTFWATIEEISKFLVVIIVAIQAKRAKEPIDLMIFCVTVALGFAALENTFFIMEPFSHGKIATGIITGNMRFIGATLVHIVSSATIGFTLGYVFYHKRIASFIAGFIGIIGAIIIHASFNLSILNASSTDTLKTFAWVWGAVVLLIILFEEIKAVHIYGIKK